MSQPLIYIVISEAEDATAFRSQEEAQKFFEYISEHGEARLCTAYLYYTYKECLGLDDEEDDSK